jgi:hypothetical protein
MNGKGVLRSGVITSDRAQIGGKDKGKSDAYITRASDQSPQKQGVCSRFSTIEISQMTPLSHNAVKADNSPLRRM